MSDSGNKLVWVVACLAITIVAVFGISHFMVEKIANRVIEKLQKEYSPSPYGPGMDPDKIMLPPAGPGTGQPTKTSWDEDWEKSRR